MTMTDPTAEARMAIESLESFAGMVEDGDRSGDLGLLIAADAIALSLLAVADRVEQHP